LAGCPYDAVVTAWGFPGAGDDPGLPDISRLSTAELERLLTDLRAAAQERPDDRLVLGKIDILRAELVARGEDDPGKSAD
jgi:hypothetical protein